MSNYDYLGLFHEATYKQGDYHYTQPRQRGEQIVYYDNKRYVYKIPYCKAKEFRAFINYAWGKNSFIRIEGRFPVYYVTPRD